MQFSKLARLTLIIRCQFFSFLVFVFLPFCFFIFLIKNHPIAGAVWHLLMVLQGQCCIVSSTLFLAIHSCRHVEQSPGNGPLTLPFFPICLWVSQWWMSLIWSSTSFWLSLEDTTVSATVCLQCTTTHKPTPCMPWLIKLRGRICVLHLLWLHKPVIIKQDEVSWTFQL